MKPSPEALSDKNTLAFLHGTYHVVPFSPDGMDPLEHTPTPGSKPV